MKTKFNLLLGAGLFCLTACDVKEVENEYEACKPEYKAEYNALVTEFEKLGGLDNLKQYQLQVDSLKTSCAEFFGRYSADVNCEAATASGEKVVKGNDFKLLCEDPTRSQIDLNLPQKLTLGGSNEFYF